MEEKKEGKERRKENIKERKKKERKKRGKRNRKGERNKRKRRKGWGGDREKKGTEKEVIEGKFHGAILRHVCELEEGRGEGKIKGEEEESRRKRE